MGETGTGSSRGHGRECQPDAGRPERLRVHPQQFLTGEGYPAGFAWRVRENAACACGSTRLGDRLGNGLYRICRDCDSYVLSQFIDEDQLGMLYGRAYWYEHQAAIGNPTIEQRYHGDAADRIPHWVNAITRLRPPPATVVELGCAHGRLLQELSALGYTVTGVEYSPEVASVARALSRVPVVGELPPGPLDVILANDVLEHVYDPQQLLRRVAGRLAGHGRLFTQVPTTLVESAIGRSLRPYYHTFIYSRECLEILAGKALLEIESVTPGMFDCFDVVWRPSLARPDQEQPPRP